MPHIVIRGIAAESLIPISGPLTEELAEICECGTDNFMIECLHTTAVFEGRLAPSFPFVEIGWFERGQETRDRCAEAVTRHIASLGITEVEVAFCVYREDSYYVNGVKCM